jgi:homeobox-leucine zipper protein
MELELGLGVSPALAKGTVMHMQTCTHAGDGEGHELVLELGVRTAKGGELDNLKASMQPEDVQEEDLYQGCPLPTGSAETGTKEFYMSESARLARYFYDRLWLKHHILRARAQVLVLLERTVISPYLLICTGSVNSSLQAEVPVRQAAKDTGGFGGRTNKKLRPSKEQYGFLEDSFKEHSTLTPVGVLITISPPCLSKRNYMSCRIFGEESWCVKI